MVGYQAGGPKPSKIIRRAWRPEPTVLELVTSLGGLTTGAGTTNERADHLKTQAVPSRERYRRFLARFFLIGLLDFLAAAIFLRTGFALRVRLARVRL